MCQYGDAVFYYFVAACAHLNIGKEAVLRLALNKTRWRRNLLDERERLCHICRAKVEWVACQLDLWAGIAVGAGILHS